MSYHIEDNNKTRLSQDYESFNDAYDMYVLCYKDVPIYDRRGVHVTDGKGAVINYDNHKEYLETM